MPTSRGGQANELAAGAIVERLAHGSLSRRKAAVEFGYRLRYPEASTPCTFLSGPEEQQSSGPSTTEDGKGSGEATITVFRSS